MHDLPNSPELLPLAPGVGYKPRHFADIEAASGGPSSGRDDRNGGNRSPNGAAGAVRWFEIHAENYMGDGGRPLAQLRELAERFPISVHGVGLSIGGEGPLDADHLGRLRRLTEWLAPASFSEHLAWSTHDGAYYNDLLPLPYTRATLERVASHVGQVQDALGRRMLLENPSSYLAFAESDWSETDFLAEVSRRSGCGLLLDVNNVFVSATNLGYSPEEYIDAFALEEVGEIHLGGHEEDGAGLAEPAVDSDSGSGAGSAPLLIDNHAAPVVDKVWTLLDRVLDRAGPRPVLVEWDNDVPDWPTLEAEARRAARALDRTQDRVAA